MNQAFFVLLALAAGALVFLQYQRRAQRRHAIAQQALLQNRAFHHADVEGLVHLDFTLFRIGDGRGVENVVAGPDDLRLFDFWYYVESESQNRQSSRSYSRFTCAVLRVPGVWMPNLTIARETLGSRLKDHVGFRDLEFESEAFNRAWEVQARDRQFAFAFLDAQMIEWLQMAGTTYRFETCGDRLLVAAGQQDPAGFFALEHVVRGFEAHIPRVVAELFPGSDGP